MRTPTKSMQCFTESSGSRLVAFNRICVASVTGKKKAARFLIAGLPGWWWGHSAPGSAREEVHLSTVMQEENTL